MSEQIKKYWKSQGEAHGSSHWASWGDNWMIELEIDLIASHIKNDQDVLDVGCANGYSSFQQIQKFNLKSLTGIDFAEEMIANANLEKEKNFSEKNVQFLVGDIRNLDFKENSFDLVYTTRVLINLPTWEEQIIGIKECLRVLRPGGKLILSEGFWEPLCLLNSLRALKSLPPLVEHDFNRYIKMSCLKNFLSEQNLSYKINDFSSIYYLGSRFLREIVTDVDKYEKFSNPINKIFFEIEKSFSGGDFGIQQAVIIEK